MNKGREFLYNVLKEAQEADILNDSGSLVIKDYLAEIESQIKNKEESVFQTIGEIRHMKMTAEILGSIIRRSIRKKEEMEERALKAEEMKSQGVEDKVKTTKKKVTNAKRKSIK